MNTGLDECGNEFVDYLFCSVDSLKFLPIVATQGSGDFVDQALRFPGQAPGFAAGIPNCILLDTKLRSLHSIRLVGVLRLVCPSRRVRWNPPPSHCSWRYPRYFYVVPRYSPLKYCERTRLAPCSNREVATGIGSAASKLASGCFGTKSAQDLLGMDCSTVRGASLC